MTEETTEGSDRDVICSKPDRRKMLTFSTVFAANAAVFGGIFGPRWRKQGDPLRMIDRVRATLWAKAQDELTTEDLAKRFERAAECAPFGVVGDRRRWFCGQPRLCPFCYGREIQELHARLRGLVLGIEVAPGAVRYDCLVSNVWLHFADRDDRSVPAGLVAKVKESRTKGIPKDAAGGYTMSVIQPFGRAAWRLSKRRVLLFPVNALPSIRERYEEARKLIPAPAAIKLDPQAARGEVLYLEAGGKQSRLTQILGRLFPYPGSLITGPVRKTVELLRALEGFRSLSTFGVMVGNKSKDSGAPE